MADRILTQGEIEVELMRVTEALEEQTEVFAEIAELAAIAEADYKLRHARAVVGLASQSGKLSVAERSARAEMIAAEELRAWKLAEARIKSTKEALLSLRARLDALRSLSANVRAQT